MDKIRKMRLPLRYRLLVGLTPGLLFLLLLAAIALAALFRIQTYVGAMSQLLAVDVGSAAQRAVEAQAHAEQFAITAFISEEIANTGRQLVVVIVLAVGGGAIFVLFFARSLAQPLAQLEQSAHQIALGQDPSSLPLHRNDEIGSLAASFDVMWRQLYESHAELTQLLAQRQQELAILTAVTRTVNESTDLSSTLQATLRQMLKVHHGRAGVICLVKNEQFQRASIVASGFEDAAEHACCCTLQEGIQCQWLQRHLPDASVQSTLIKVHDRLVGVLHGATHADESCKSCPPFIEAVGQQLGVAIENARLYTEEQQQRRLAETLRDIAADLSHTLDLEKVLTIILQDIGRVLTVDAGAIFLMEHETLCVKAVRGRRELHMERWLEYRFPLQDARHLQEVLISLKPRTFCQPNRRTLFEQGIDRLEEVEWCLVVPLVSRGRAIGLLALEQIGHCYGTQEELMMASAFADHAAVAIENARLYRMVEEWNQDLELQVQLRTQELEQAHGVLARQSEQLRALLNSTVDIQEEERDRIARDIHDGVVQWILCAMYELEALAVSQQRSEEALRRRLTAVQSTLQHAKDELYEVIHDLHPPLLRSDGLLTALKALTTEVQRSTPLTCRLRLHGEPHRLAPKQELAVYRIVQESIRNALTHAHARHIDVNVGFDAMHVQFQIIDDGDGFLPDAVPPDRLGLASMYERAQSIGALLRIESQPGAGARICLELMMSDSETLSGEPCYVDSRPVGG